MSLPKTAIFFCVGYLGLVLPPSPPNLQQAQAKLWGEPFSIYGF
ncbi:MAG: hypothetical protein NT070_22695 [Cyanobacteria bacterium]|nr:hypothetical protein [Cyanobacteriota bacterium]